MVIVPKNPSQVLSRLIKCSQSVTNNDKSDDNTYGSWYNRDYFKSLVDEILSRCGNSTLSIDPNYCQKENDEEQNVVASPLVDADSCICSTGTSSILMESRNVVSECDRSLEY